MSLNDVVVHNFVQFFSAIITYELPWIIEQKLVYWFLQYQEAFFSFLKQTATEG